MPNDFSCQICSTPWPENLLIEIPETIDDSIDNLDGDLDFNMDENDFPTKVKALLDDLGLVRYNDSMTNQVTKSIVFSQFTALLTFLEVIKESIVDSSLL